MLMSVIFLDLAETVEFFRRRTSTVIAGDREMSLILGERRLAAKVRRRGDALRLIHCSRGQIVQTNGSRLIRLRNCELVLNCEKLAVVCRPIDQGPQMRTAKYRCADAASLIAAAASA